MEKHRKLNYEGIINGFPTDQRTMQRLVMRQGESIITDVRDVRVRPWCRTKFAIRIVSFFYYEKRKNLIDTKYLSIFEALFTEK